VELSRRGHAVTAIDNLSGSPGWDNLTELDTDSQVMSDNVDITRQDEVEGFFKEYGHFDVLFHLAADATEGRSQFMPVYCTDNNYMGYVRVLKEAIKYGVKRVVVISSMATYGAQTPPFSEDMPRLPEDIYGLSKAAMERATEILSQVFGFEYVIVRPHNVVGPHQYLQSAYRNVVAIWVNACHRNRKFYIYGDGTSERAFSYIGDVIPPLANCLHYPVQSQIINLGAEKPYTLNELSQIVLSHFPSAPAPEYLPLRPLEVKRAFATVTKSINLLGYRDITSLHEGVGRLVAWVRKHGPVEPVYTELELTNDLTPKAWTQQLY